MGIIATSINSRFRFSDPHFTLRVSATWAGELSPRWSPSIRSNRRLDRPAPFARSWLHAHASSELPFASRPLDKPLGDVFGDGMAGYPRSPLPRPRDPPPSYGRLSGRGSIPNAMDPCAPLGRQSSRSAERACVRFSRRGEVGKQPPTAIRVPPRLPDHHHPHVLPLTVPQLAPVSPSTHPP